MGREGKGRWAQVVVVPLMGRVGRSRSIKEQLLPPLAWSGSGWHSWPGGLSSGGQDWLQTLSDGGGEALGCSQV